MIKILVFLLLLTTTPTLAGEQRRFWDSRGNSVGTATTDSQGTTVYRDSRGNVVGRSSRPSR